MELLQDLFIKGGPVMWPLLLCSIISLTITFERIIFWFFLNCRYQSDIINKIFKYTENGRFREALDIAYKTKDKTKNIFIGGLNNIQHSYKDNMQRAAVLLIDKMKRGLRVLNLVITMSPLLGILGTVIGIIQSFDILGIKGIEDPQAVISGIAQALITTAVGLSIALVTLIPYNFFLYRLQKGAREIEDLGTKFEEALQKGLKNEASNRL